MVTGWNCANAVDHFGPVPDAQLIALIKAMGTQVLRFPGGTVSQEWHPTSGELPKMVALAKACNLPVLWVANIFTGSDAETIAALNEFSAQGVPILGVEIGNEMHLKDKYGGFCPTADIYLYYASQTAAAIRAAFPGVPVGVTMAPPPVLRDLGGYPTDRINTWNERIYNCPWADAVILHAYAHGATSVEYTTKLFPKAMAEIKKATTKAVWVTEHGLKDGHGEPIQGDHYVRMLKRFAKHPQLTIATAHNLLAGGTGYNFIQSKTTGPGKPINYVPTLLGQTAINYNA